MKRCTLALLVCLLSAVSAFAGTIPITGTIQLPDGSKMNGKVRFILSYSAARDTSNNNITVASDVSYNVANGSLPSNAGIVPNDVLQPANTWYTVQYLNGYGSLIGQNTFYVQGTSFDIGSATPTPVTTSNISFGSFTGLTQVTAKNINNVRMCDTFTGTTAGAKIVACIADLPSTGGTADARGLEGAQTIAVDPFTGVTKPITLLWGAGTWSSAVSLTVPVNVTIDFPQGGILSMAAATTGTITGGIQGTSSQHFAGAGSIAIASSKISDIPAAWWGAVGDGVTDSTTAIQSALNAVASAGTNANGNSVSLNSGRYITTSTLTIKSNTRLHGPSFSMVSSGPYPAAIIQSTADTPILSPASNPSWAVTIDNLTFWGTANSGSKGIYGATTTSSWTLRDLFFNNFGDQAIHLTAGAGGQYENLFVQNAVLVRSGRTDYVGAVDIAVSDAYWSYVTATASVTGLGNIGSGWIAGIVNRGTNSFMDACVGHLSQVGIVIAGDLIRVTANRADLNQGYGFVVTGGQNDLVNNLAYRNSRTANGAYSGFKITEANNSLSMNRAADLTGDTVFQLYGFDDSSINSGGVAVSSNRYYGNRAFNQTSTTFNFTGATTKLFTEIVGSSFVVSSQSGSSASITVPHIIGSGAAPGIAVGVALGTGASSATLTGTDLAGTISVTTACGGPCPAGASRIALVTYAVPFAVAPKGILLTPGNVNASTIPQPAFVSVASATTSNFEFASGGTALTNATTYVWTYVIIQ